MDSFNMDFEPGRENLGTLTAYYKTHKGQRNEATTRFQLIDSLFFDCLGWQKADVLLEEHHKGEFADYIFVAPRHMLIVEAKREGIYFEVPVGTSSQLERSMSSLLRDNKELKKAVEQVARYCQERGVPLGSVANGHQLVVFVANRQDGEPPLEGKALVFSSLEQMYENFLVLWNALSKPAIQDKKLLNRLLGESLPVLPPKLSASISKYPGVKNRNIFQADLQILSELVIEDITRKRELEETFLRECYAQSGALGQYSSISKNILSSRYASIFDTSLPSPTLQPAVDRSGIAPALYSESIGRRPILLIGDVGVGKTTFIRNLIKIDAVEIFQQAISLYIDLGSQATLAINLHSFVMDEIERQLYNTYKLTISDDGFVRSVYFLKIKDFEKGIYGKLQAVNPQAYIEKEIEFLDGLLKDKQQFLKDALAQITKSLRKQIVIFLDNVDQRDEHLQQQAFLISQEIAEHWPVVIFVTLRPETYHRSLRLGALSGYHPKAFTISPPRIDRVIKRRLQFALKLTSGQVPIRELASGISVNVSRLDLVIRAFLDTLERDNTLFEAIENISGGNVRLALEMIRIFFGSGHVDTEKIYEIYHESGRYLVPLHEFLRAVIYGDTEHFDPDRSPIVNLFDITTPDGREHFLLPLFIELVDYMGRIAGDEGFVSTTEVYRVLQGMGFTPEQIDTNFVKAQRKKLIETAERRIPEPNQAMPQTVRSTTIGKYHSEKLVSLFAYVDAVIVDTHILDRKVSTQIADVKYLGERLDRAEIFCQYLDEQWKKLALDSTYFDWNSHSSSLHNEIAELKRRHERSSQY